MMSNQAERIRAYKHAQHARLQKQEEEEQWISSEELCTEGSSDEEIHISTKLSHRKPKRSQPTEKRGISPLAQPPKTFETESTYQRDSKYLLPDPQAMTRGLETTDIEDDVEELDINASCSNTNEVKAQLCKSHDKSDSSSSSASSMDDVNDEIILWRPKRGSIKLPELPEEKICTTEHDIFEEAALFTEISANVNHLKQSCVRNRIFPVLNKTPEEEKNRKVVVNDKLMSLFESMTKLDEEISDRIDLFEAQKKERKIVQEEMCHVINSEEITRGHSKTSETFLHLCNFENEYMLMENDKDLQEAGSKFNDYKCKMPKKTKISGKDFVTRNIQLARQSTMSFSLTDEEKLKLDVLLSDIDSEKYSTAPQTSKSNTTDNNSTEGEHQTIGKIVYRNYFRLEVKEETYIQDLDSKLTEILKSYEERGEKLKEAFEETKEIDDLLQSADNEGKLWKHFNLQQRLERIEKDLSDIALKDTEEKEPTTASDVDEIHI